MDECFRCGASLADGSGLAAVAPDGALRSICDACAQKQASERVIGGGDIGDTTAVDVSRQAHNGEPRL